MGDEREPGWHWDEQRALREELADVTLAAVDERARLERELAYWRARAERAEERERRFLRWLAGALLSSTVR